MAVVPELDHATAAEKSANDTAQSAATSRIGDRATLSTRASTPRCNGSTPATRPHGLLRLPGPAVRAARGLGECLEFYVFESVDPNCCFLAGGGLIGPADCVAAADVVPERESGARLDSRDGDAPALEGRRDARGLLLTLRRPERRM